MSSNPPNRNPLSPESLDEIIAMFSAFQRTQMAAFERLTNGLEVGIHASPRYGSFAGCMARFCGNLAEVDLFVRAVETYMDAYNVSEENALRGLGMLLMGPAAIWWASNRSQCTTWREAITRLRRAFGGNFLPMDTPQIYREVFAREQGLSESTVLFVARLRSYFSRLPPGELSEKTQVDMVYGLLHDRIRSNMRRDGIRSFVDLLNQAREIEKNIEDREHYEEHHGAAAAAVPMASPMMYAGVSRPHVHYGGPIPPPNIAFLPRMRIMSPHSSRMYMPPPMAPAESMMQDEAQRPESPEMQCDNCGQYSHILKDCPTLAYCFTCETPGVNRAVCNQCNQQIFAPTTIYYRTPHSDGLPVWYNETFGQNDENEHDNSNENEGEGYSSEDHGANHNEDEGEADLNDNESEGNPNEYEVESYANEDEGEAYANEDEGEANPIEYEGEAYPNEDEGEADPNEGESEANPNENEGGASDGEDVVIVKDDIDEELIRAWKSYFG